MPPDRRIRLFEILCCNRLHCPDDHVGDIVPFVLSPQFVVAKHVHVFECVLHGIDVCTQKLSDIDVVHDIDNVNSVRVEQFFDLLIELVRRELIRHREVVERVADNHVVGTIGEISGLHTGVFVIRNDPGVQGQPEVLVRNSGHDGIDLDDLNMPIRVPMLDQSRHGIPATADEKNFRCIVPIVLERDEVGRDLLITVDEECRVFLGDVTVQKLV